MRNSFVSYPWLISAHFQKLQTATIHLLFFLLREGPFYFLFADKDGEKYGRANKLSGLDKALAAGATEITKEEYFARKNGTYTGLPQNVDTAEDSEQPEPIKVTADEVNKIMQAANISQPDADKLLAASRGEFVE